MMFFKIVTTIGLPELSTAKDIEFIRDHLVLELNEEESSLLFKSLMNSALSNKLVKFNDLFHKLKNYK
jgi:hypothetical protein